MMSREYRKQWGSFCHGLNSNLSSHAPCSCRSCAGRQRAAALHPTLSGRATSPAAAHHAQRTGRALRAATAARGSRKHSRERLHGSVLPREQGAHTSRGKAGMEGNGSPAARSASCIQALPPDNSPHSPAPGERLTLLSAFLGTRDQGHYLYLRGKPQRHTDSCHVCIRPERGREKNSGFLRFLSSHLHFCTFKCLSYISRNISHLCAHNMLPITGWYI